MAQKRSQGIKTLEKDVLELGEMFRDISELVDEQQIAIDSVDDHITHSVVHVKRAGNELLHAEEYQKKSRKRKLCCCILMVILLAILALVIYVLTKN